MNEPYFDQEGNYRRDCSRCGRSFFFKKAEQEFYKEHDYDFPKRCWNCRKQRRKFKDKKASVAVYKPATSAPATVSEFEKSWE